VHVVLADFNGDHRRDIAVTNNSSNTVSILLNNGSGGFTAAASPATGAGPRGMAAGDVDGDGDTDLVVDNFSANSLSILLNNGAGVFTARRNFGDWEQPLPRGVGRPRRRWRSRYRNHQLR
jgi:hypothetical protein